MGISPAILLPSRVGLLGDIHTEADRLRATLAHFQREGIEAILCTGDIADGPEEVWGLEECCELLSKPDIYSICGNHDRWLLEGAMRDRADAVHRFELESDTIAFLEQLPPTETFDTPIGPLQLCHGIGSDDMALVLPLDSTDSLKQNVALQTLLTGGQHKAIVNGHSHRRMVRTVGDVVLINAGTLHRDHEPGFGVIDFTKAQVEFFSVSAPAAIQQIATMPFSSPAFAS